MKIVSILDRTILFVLFVWKCIEDGNTLRRKIFLFVERIFKYLKSSFILFFSLFPAPCHLYKSYFYLSGYVRHNVIKQISYIVH